MSILYAILLGIVQGLTEFLPVSSSGHLVLLHRIFGIEEPTLFFDIMLHVGTLAAVIAVLWRDILAILQRLVQPLTGFLILATIPTVVAAIIFRKPIEHAFATGQLLGVSFLITAALLTTAELLSRRAANNLRKADEMNWMDALIIGILQAIAIIPGVSRSGATITGALSRRLNRDFAARFVFLLSIPAILGALALHLKELAADGIDSAALGGMGAMEVIIGTVTAAIVGFFAVRFMMKIIREKSLFCFAIYTGVLGTLILVDQFGTRIIF
ncbi:MAG: undecaprenyl-diphosphate phosphatase [Spirochaetes bacterium]|nr:undecaprenyl-diphosphate phosphatase [Spirochaetota bacterium]